MKMAAIIPQRIRFVVCCNTAIRDGYSRFGHSKAPEPSPKRLQIKSASMGGICDPQSPRLQHLTGYRRMAGKSGLPGKLDVASNFSISCIECRKDVDCNVNRGTCENSQCVCHPHSAGDFCNEDKPCEDLILFYDAESIDYTIVSSKMAYGRPMYNDAIVEGFDVEVLLYTGRRWFDTYFSQEDFKKLLENDVHAYWDDVLLNNTRWYSETTDKYIPTWPLDWYWISDAGNAGNYGPFGREYDDPQRFECQSVDCEFRSGICGKGGNCEEGKCKCSDGFEGHFCEFYIWSSSPSTSPVAEL